MAELGFTVIDDGRAAEVASAEGVERARRAQGAGRPAAIDPDERAAYLGVAASVRARALASPEAPDFTLPDLDGAKLLGALRAWVRGEAAPLSEGRARELQALPTETHQQARAEFGLGQWLFEHGRAEAAARHFERAGELAPHDFTIRRGTMPMRGIDPMGPAFREMLGAWTKAGNPYYRPLPE